MELLELQLAGWLTLYCASICADDDMTNTAAKRMGAPPMDVPDVMMSGVACDATA